MRKILFPTDFSETANNAFLYALNLAQSHDATLYVLHVYNLPAINGNLSANLIQNVYETVKFGQFENFKDYIPNLRKIAEENGFENVAIKFILEEGNLIYILKEIIATENINNIVMGTTGGGGVEKIIFGSNTINAITTLKTPVLSVPNHIKFNGIKNIGFTTVFSEKDKESLNYIIEVAYRNKAKVQCLHVSKTNEFDETLFNKWIEEFKNDPVEFTVVKNPSPEDAVLYFLKDKKIDILAAVSRNRGFFEKLFSPSLTKKIASKNTVPLFVFHENEN